MMFRIKKKIKQILSASLAVILLFTSIASSTTYMLKCCKNNLSSVTNNKINVTAINSNANVIYLMTNNSATIMKMPEIVVGSLLLSQSNNNSSFSSSADNSSDTIVEDIRETNKDNDSNRWKIELTSEEIDLLARIVWNEARGEEILGQYAVIEVVLNRLASPGYGHTLEAVLSKKNAFSTWSLRNVPLNTKTNYNAQIQAVNDVLDGKTEILPMNTFYFAMTPLGNNIVAKIGCHFFTTDWVRKEDRLYTKDNYVINNEN